ncbi:MAG: hypothetical protein IK095_06180 [Oscillospiraceae bacterium]|nr:hypothetical protein [Oscillospiraceae bacterium]
MIGERAKRFLVAHGMDPETIQPARDAVKIAEEMERGLAGTGGSMPMIPTYVSDEGEIPCGSPVAVIDAGGTNFRCALVRFEADGCHVEELRKWKMPGIGTPTTWERFISFVADAVQPLLDRTDRIGFCFSYSADITPEMDGKVHRIDKEVVIRGCEGQMVGGSLLGELERRGVCGKKIVILNDTVAVLLGGLADGKRGEGCMIGQVSGTGTNTCCSLPVKRIGKLGSDSERHMIVNMESGMYDGIERGDLDRMLDEASKDPGKKHFEKLTAGVYLGELVRRILVSAADEGLLSAGSAEKARALGWIDSAVIDAWSMGEDLDRVSDNAEDAAFVRDIATAMFERSARCMCTDLAGIMLLSGEEKGSVCAEGSLVQKGRVYRPMLEQLIREEIEGKLGRQIRFSVAYETTLAGSAVAALLNL